MRPLAVYSFLPWLRRGIANEITAADDNTNVALRASIDVTVRVTGQPVGGGAVRTEDVPKTVQLYGPGDVIGIDPKAVVRTEPRPWITNFESNYLPFVEFYDEDFPWRYTPAAPNPATGRLRPWITLIVLKADEFEPLRTASPLPYITVPDLGVLPDASQAWAWAHVHLNRSLAATDAEIVSDDMNAVLPRLQAVLNANPDDGLSRLLSPRRLDPTHSYHAFVVPTFESGRLAGLGADPGATPNATHGSWEPYPSGTRPQGDRLPVYYHWEFRTGTVGDFEYLVRLLKPRTVDTRVGNKDTNVLHPGYHLPPISKPALDGVLRLGGALRVPETTLDEDEAAQATTYEEWDQPYPDAFQKALAAFVNLADAYPAQAVTAANANAAAAGLTDVDPADPDPLVVPPLYGRWHALAGRVLRDRAGAPLDPDDNWLHELNLDPRFRVAAGYGTSVVQANQEDYMAAAWEQVGDVLEANRRIRAAQFARQVAKTWHQRHLEPVRRSDPGTLLALTAPVHARVRHQDVTVSYLVANTALTPAPLSAPMRRAIRPGAPLAKALQLDRPGALGVLVGKIVAGTVAAAPPKTRPPIITTVGDVAAQVKPGGVGGAVGDALHRRPWLRFLPLVVALIIVLLLLAAVPLAAAFGAGAVVIAIAVALWRWLEQLLRNARRTSVVGEDLDDDAVDALPSSPDFTITDPGPFTPPTFGGTDNDEARRFKAALRDLSAVFAATDAADQARRPRFRPFDVAATAATVVDAIHPDKTIFRRMFAGMSIPDRLRDQVVEKFQEAMAYPEFDIPMYKPLVGMGSERFLPNINLIPNDSITLLLTNQRFIESYLVGLNHEMARELLWREYPTDQRGSYFRQFWDPSSYMPGPGDPTDPAALKEKLRDIPRLDHWPRASGLGHHDHRQSGGPPRDELVLVIRGELLKKYPTAVIYAQRAAWVMTNGHIDPTKERVLVDPPPDQEDRPPRTIIKTPLYEAKAEPDIYFFGFDLEEEEAKGDTGANPSDDPGWFFVIKERPGEPRFGADLERPPASPVEVWNDFAWSDLLGQPVAPYIEITPTTPTRNVVAPTGDDVQEKGEQYNDDRHVSWSANASSADIAYVLYQVPVLVAVHAAEMLKRD